jgi:predicted SPOUT superfamily RNA methylase MTH1
MPEVTQGLIRQLGREPQPLNSKNKEREATYWGFDTKDVPEETLKTFFRLLADAVNDLL